MFIAINGLFYLSSPFLSKDLVRTISLKFKSDIGEGSSIANYEYHLYLLVYAGC